MPKRPGRKGLDRTSSGPLWLADGEDALMGRSTLPPAETVSLGSDLSYGPCRFRGVCGHGGDWVVQVEAEDTGPPGQACGEVGWRYPGGSEGKRRGGVEGCAVIGVSGLGVFSACFALVV